MQEIWKDIPWYEWYYSISSFWDVYSYKSDRVIKQFLSAKKYKIVQLCKDAKCNTKFIHRLVAMAHIRNPIDWEEINHINSDRCDNSVNNLEWCTHKENIRHSFKSWSRSHKGRLNTMYGKKWILNKKSKPVYQYNLEWKFIKMFYSWMDAQRETGISSWWISNTCLWRAKQSGWYIWSHSKTQ